MRARKDIEGRARVYGRSIFDAREAFMRSLEMNP
jgi:hypothetical protein